MTKQNIQFIVRPTALLFALLTPAWAGRGVGHYALVLEEPPVAAVIESGKDLRKAAAEGQRSRVRAAQHSLRAALAGRGVRVTGAVENLANVVFVQAAPEEAEQLRGLPGVKYLQPMLPLRRKLDAAAGLVNAPAAWSALGGAPNAGAGVKIGILDTGIDIEHAAFQDASLRPPAGFPKCRPEDCVASTNGKVIAARSYVEQLVYYFPDDTRPDDASPRDRVGHGTAAAMVAGGVQVTGPAAAIRGIAPKAYLGNYKIFGSPGVNDVTFDDVVMQALDEAFLDGMDIVSLSLGSPALWAASDAGSICGKAANAYCDVRVDMVETAANKGMLIIVSAGNSGDMGIELPALTTVESPGTAPSALTVGASTNSHIYYSSVGATGAGVPADLQRINALFGNGPRPAPPLTAPLRDVSKLQDNGRACSPLTAGSLAGAIALIERGDCAFRDKVIHAQRAGALGVILFQNANTEFIFADRTLGETGIPMAMIGRSGGAGLKTFIAANPEREATMDPSLRPVSAAADEVAYFSSQGPALGDLTIKPEIVAVGTDLYLATQKYDPNGEMYDPSGFTSAQGTSFSAPMAAGAAALVKQKNPGFNAVQIKSALVNTASGTLTDYDYQGNPVPARVTAVGAGKLNAGDAVTVTVTADPPAISFGSPRSVPVARTLRLTNGGSSQVRVDLGLAQQDQDTIARVTVNPASATINAGASAVITVRLEGGGPRPGTYQGFVTVRGGGAALRIPYLYQVGDGAAFNAFQLTGDGIVGVVAQEFRCRVVAPCLRAKFLDRYGFPIDRLAVQFRTVSGGGRIQNATPSSDELGIVQAEFQLGAQSGENVFSVEGGGLRLFFYPRGVVQPVIRQDGVVNAASLRAGGLAPGSYISIFGTALSPALRVASTPSLPLSLATVSVGFDVPGRTLSYPARLHFVSENQINVQIPWELEGFSSVRLKVSIGDISTALYTLPLSNYSPGVFEYTEPASGRMLAAALDQNFRLVGTANPAGRGRAIQVYINGLGPVDNRPPSGEPSPASPLSSTKTTPAVTIGGRPAQVLFSGLAPYNVGLYQVNLVVPQDAPTGIQPLAVTVEGAVAKTASIPVQ